MLLACICALASASSGLDVAIDQNDYYTAPPSGEAYAGEPVNVFVKIHVLQGDLEENMTMVLLHNGTPVFYNNITENIKENGTTGVWFGCFLPVGKHNLTVVANPEWVPQETVTDNNVLELEYSVLPVNETGNQETPPVNGGDDSDVDLFEYIPYILIGLLVLVSALVVLAVYIFEKRRREETDR